MAAALHNLAVRIRPIALAVVVIVLLAVALTLASGGAINPYPLLTARR